MGYSKSSPENTDLNESKEGVAIAFMKFINSWKTTGPLLLYYTIGFPDTPWNWNETERIISFPLNIFMFSLINKNFECIGQGGRDFYYSRCRGTFSSRVNALYR